MHEDKGNVEEEVPDLLPALVPLAFHQAAQHLQALLQFARQEKCLKLNNAIKQTALSRQL